MDKDLIMQSGQSVRGPEVVFCRLTERRPFNIFAVPVIGIDIGRQSIKVVEINKGLRSSRLLSAKIVDIYPDGPPEDTQEYLITDNVRDALKTALIGFRLEKSRIVVSVGGSSVMIRQIQLPFMESKKLESAISWEAKRFLPYNPEEMVISTKILHHNKQQNKMDVLLVAVQKKLLHYFNELLAYCSVKPDIIDAGPLATINALRHTHKNNEEQTKAVLDIGASLSTLTLHGRDCPIFSRTIAISGDTFTNIIKNKLNISYCKAEIMKRTESSIFEMVKPYYDKLISQIHQTFIYYGSLSARKKVTKFYISGGSAFMPMLVNYLSTELNITAEVINPLREIEFSRDIRNYRNEFNLVSPQLTHAIGLALR